MRYEDMLKGHDERDMVASLEYQGKGTIQVEGQPCTLTKFRASNGPLSARPLQMRHLSRRLFESSWSSSLENPGQHIVAGNVSQGRGGGRERE